MKNPKLYPLAAICQAAQLALQLSSTGHCDAQALQTQLNSLFILDPKNVEEVYGNNFDQLKLGLAYLELSLKNPIKSLQGISAHIILSFGKLAKSILCSSETQKKVRTQLERIHEQTHYFGSWQHPRVMENLSQLYIEVANQSNLRLKIIGQKKYLQDLEVLNQVRAILFSGVRAAVLWYQLGGNIFWLMWNRKSLLKEIKALLHS